MIGDDQSEWFSAGQPARALHLLGRHGGKPAAAASRAMAPSLRRALLGLLRRRREPDLPRGRGARPAPGRDAHARPSSSTWPTSGCSRGTRPFGHAWSFVHQRLMGDRVVPIVPVLLNTYYPPNQPTPRRCYQLGRAIRAGGRGLADPPARGHRRLGRPQPLRRGRRRSIATCSTCSPRRTATRWSRCPRTSSNPATPRSATGSRRPAPSSI